MPTKKADANRNVLASALVQIFSMGRVRSVLVLDRASAYVAFAAASIARLFPTIAVRYSLSANARRDWSAVAPFVQPDLEIFNCKEPPKTKSALNADLGDAEPADSRAVTEAQ
jgi:hypothetical protein